MRGRRTRVRSLLGAATLTLALTACSADADTTSDEPLLPSDTPSGNCPSGFKGAVAGFWVSEQSTARTTAARIGLGLLSKHVACVIEIRENRPADRGALIVIRNDAPPQAVARALTRLGYRSATAVGVKVWMRDDARHDQAAALARFPYQHWFAKLLPSVVDGHQEARRFRFAFPEDTTTFYATFPAPPKKSAPDQTLFPPATPTPTAPPTPASQTPEPPPAPAAWSCWYEPTMDDDWHNDIVCSNGTEGHRPYLREWDSFVTYPEIMASAREYQAHLNS